MNYLRLDNKRKKATNLDLYGGVILLLVLFIIFYIARGFLVYGFHSIESSVASVFARNQFIVRSEDDKALIQTLEADTAELQTELGKKNAQLPTQLAVVIVRPPMTPYDSLIIDAGKAQGIHPGDVVYGEAEYAIGKVAEVYPNSSLVILFSSAGQNEQVLIGTSSSSTMAIAQGQGGGNFFIKLPRNVNVTLGAPVIWPDSTVVLLGMIEKIDNQTDGTYSHLYFKSPINIDSLRYVQIKPVIH